MTCLRLSEQIIMLCVVERDSVAAGDDFDAPHREVMDIAIADAESAPILACVRHIATQTNYLPSVAGGSTWIAYANDLPIAVVALFDAPEIYCVDGTPMPAEHEVKLQFAYYLANNPQRIIRQLAAGKRPDRIYGNPPIG